ncbi:MAG: MBL fold metallo-hydrolase [Halioglobus sp.]|nr:MBL fold metallo-hydrolase [Halioglobus sp.]
MTPTAIRQSCLLAIFSLTLVACGGGDDIGAQGNTPATDATRVANANVKSSLPLADQRDFEDATRGLIATPEALVITGEDGAPVWNMSDYDFIAGEVPDTVNPSLWRQATLNNIHGLFKVTEGIYQVRGFDLANMTIIEGDTGWIIVDPLTAKETAAAAIAFAREHLEEKPITAVIFTHSHIDHFGGILGLLSDEELEGVEIIAPEGFMEESTSENVIAGVTMSRRSMFMYGASLEKSARGHVGSGLGKSPSLGSPGILAPTLIVDSTGDSLEIDGMEFIFQNTPGSEAPAELMFYLPELQAFCGAEVVSRNMHNLYTLRGAKVRDALRWSHYIDEAIDMFGDADVYFASHHWPLWGNEAITDFLKKQRDGYKFIHDQTLRLASRGHTPREIAEMLKFPESLRTSFPNRGYYGTLKHNAKAVYQGYFGWYDGNPANLDPLPPEEAAERYIERMGGADEVLEEALEDFEDGDYRWVAEVLNHLVFADPGNDEARELLAATYDQLGYQAESGPWRDVYLTGALELRHGPPEQGVGIARAADMLRETPLEQFFYLMGAMLDAEKAEDEDYVIAIEFTDLGETHVLYLENAVLHHRTGAPPRPANATIRITHALFIDLLTRQAGLRDTLFSDDVSVDGSRMDLIGFFGLLDQPNEVFNIVTP